MRVLMIASECVPFAKTGGLADVVGALPRALTNLGHRVDVVIPRYRGIAAGARCRPRYRASGGSTRRCGRVHHRRSWRAIRVHRPPRVLRSGAAVWDRQRRLSGQSRSIRAPESSCARVGRIIWGALRCRPCARLAGGPRACTACRGSSGQPTPFVTPRQSSRFTIWRTRGVFDPGWLPRLGLGRDLMHVDALEYWGRISFLKAGIVFSRLITTVSPQYAKEIQTPPFGFGFDGILRSRAGDLIGILNGIDYDQWDPCRDRYLPVPYDAITPGRKGRGETPRARDVWIADG